MRVDESSYLSRREFEAWLRDVYTYRQEMLSKELAEAISVLNSLRSIVDKAESASIKAEHISQSVWFKVGAIGAVMAPIALVAVTVWATLQK